MRHGRRKRLWSDEEKRLICQQAAAPGVSVAQVARRHAMNANLIFNWLRDPRYAPDASESDAAPVFLPVELTSAASLAERVRPSDRSGGGRIEIALSCGHRISVEGACDPDLLLRVLQGLMS